MADKEKKKKKKKEEEVAPEPVAEASPEPERKPSTRSSKRAKRAGSSVFSMFSQKQLQEFKEGFQLMDADKDGILNKNDLRQTLDMVGRLATDAELEKMLKEAPGPVNFTMMLTMFAERMSGGTDDDDVVKAAFQTFDEDGKIDCEKLRHNLMTFGEKFSADEVDDCFEQFPIDPTNKVDTQALLSLLLASAVDDEEEEAS